MQKIILFVEPSDNAYETPGNIGNLFMNRFAVDEDASIEILKIFELCNKQANKGTDNFVARNFTSKRYEWVELRDFYTL